MKNTKKIRKSKSKNGARNTILALVLVGVLCLVGVIVLTCNNEPKEEITKQEALQIALDDLGLTSEQAGDPHIHEGTHDNQSCYNIYITANGESLLYVVSTEGEILHKGEGEHSH